MPGWIGLAIEEEEVRSYPSEIVTRRGLGEREQAQKSFQNDLKRHIEKTSQYLSEEDSIYQCVMFIPSDVVYLAINELRFYRVVEDALQKKV